MKLRTKTVIIFMVMTFLLVGIVHTISSTILLNSYNQLEQKGVSETAARVQGALLNQYSTMATKAGDWATWDDSYEFVQDNNSAFSQTNLVPYQFVNLDLNFLLYFNSSGRYVDGMGFDLVNATEIPVPRSLLTLITSNDRIWNFQDVNGSLAGVVLTPHGPLLLASRPILTTLGEGPVRGAVIFARYFDSQYVESLSKTVHLPLNLTLFNSWRGLANSFTSTEPSIYVHPLNATSIVGYVVMDDVDGRPALVLAATMSRDTYQRGLQTLNYVDLSVSAACVLFSFAMLALVQTSVLSRLHKLHAQVTSIGNKNARSAKVSVSGNDEISYLGRSINGMLVEIEKKTLQLQKAERFSAIGELATMVAHDLRNPLQGIANAVFYLKRANPSAGAKEKGVLEVIEEDVKYSNKILSDLLDYSRDLRLELKETNPQLLLKQSLSAIMIPENVRVRDESENNPTLRLDVDKIKRAFVNIISNAIDAMPNGGSLLIQSRESDHRVDFIFADSGVGIEKESLGKLFAPLYTTKARGMGFGLAIAKQVAEAHGGRISVESTLGKGTAFTISLPLNGDSKGGENLE